MALNNSPGIRSIQSPSRKVNRSVGQLLWMVQQGMQVTKWGCIRKSAAAWTSYRKNSGKWKKKNCKFQTGTNSERSQDLMLTRLNISACDEVKHSSDT